MKWIIPSIGIALLSCLYIALRVSAASLPLVGEDGIFASILFKHPSKPSYIHYGRINGQELYMPVEHPTLMHEVISQYGKAWQLLVPTNHFDLAQQTFYSRLWYSLFSYLGFIVIAAALYYAAKASSVLVWAAPLFSVFVLLSTPLAILNSTELQMDTSIGFLISAVFCAYIIVADKLTASTRNCILFISALLFGIGKNEWSLLFLVAQVLVHALYVYLYKTRKRWPKPPIIEAVTAFAGLAVGNVLSYWWDPYNYTAGWNLMISLGTNQSILNPSVFKDWVFMNYIHFVMIAWYGLLFAVALWLAIKKEVLKNPYLFQLGILAICLFAPFFFSMKGALHSRFFAPASIALFTFIASAATPWVVKYPRQMAIIGLIVITFSQASVVITVRNAQQIAATRSIPLGNGICIPRMEIAQGFYLDKDYILNSLSKASAQKLIDPYGKVICN